MWGSFGPRSAALHTLQFRDSFVEQSHFAEGDAEVVVRLRIFFGLDGMIVQSLP